MQYSEYFIRKSDKYSTHLDKPENFILEEILKIRSNFPK